jgi:hypothetical protein
MQFLEKSEKEALDILVSKEDKWLRRALVWYYGVEMCDRIES